MQNAKCICEGSGISTTSRIGPVIKRLGGHADETAKETEFQLFYINYFQVEFF